MFVKNNIAQPGGIKAVFLDPHQIEVKLRSGEVMRYERKEERQRAEIPAVSSLREEGALQGEPQRTVPVLRVKPDINTRAGLVK